uniref:Uncharacterized protein n=1 Tax=Anopheles dirus TaxID=7168 RepID=A0A182NIT4_9DIPT
MECSLFSTNSNSSESSAVASSTSTVRHAAPAASPAVGHGGDQAGPGSGSSSIGEVSSTCSVGSADDTVSSPGYINTATESSISSLDDLKNEGRSGGKLF